MIRALLALIATVFAIIVISPIIILGLPFWIVAFLTRRIHPLIEPRTIQLPQMFEYDALLGWRVKANLDCYCLHKGDYIFHVKTDVHGWSGAAELLQSKIVVVGDSHAFGYGVDHSVSFSELNPTLSVKPIGVPGYNVVQELLLMEQLASQLSGKMVVWFIYVGNDLLDNLAPEMNGYRTPFVRRANGKGDWEIVTTHLSAAKWTTSSRAWASSRMLPELYSDTFLAERAYSACEFLIARGHKICRQVGADLVVMSIPAPFELSGIHEATADPGLPDQKIEGICQGLGITFVPLSRSLDIKNGGVDYKLRDDHWTERGHQRVAEELYAAYQVRCAAAQS